MKKKNTKKIAMKNLYTSMFFVLIAVASFAQNNSYKSNGAVIENGQIVAIEDNQIVNMVEVKNKAASNNEDNYRYYYYPNLYAYFDLQTNKFIYKYKNKWQTSSELPQYYGGYSAFKNAKVPLRDYAGTNPQEKLNQHKTEYPYITKSTMSKSMDFKGNKEISSLN